MSNSNVRQAGFGVVGIFAVVLVVVVLASAGYIVTNKQVKQNSADLPRYLMLRHLK